MKKFKRWHHIPFFVTFLTSITLLICVFWLMNYVQQLLNSDAQINLTEIVTQNKDVITSKLMLEINDLKSVSDQISDRFSQNQTVTQEDLKDIFLTYSNEKGDSNIFIGFEDGGAIFPDGTTLDISGRQYYRLALEGRQNISERIVSRVDGNDIFVISVPLTYKGVIIGTMQRQYTTDEMYNLCSISLFSEQGSMYIINNQGYILFSSQQNLYNRESDNYYRMLFSDNPEESRRLEQDIKNNQSGFLKSTMGGKATFSAYTPVDQIYDWYLISSVDTSAVSPNATVVIRLFYFILLTIVLFFSLLGLFYVKLKQKEQKKLMESAFLDPITKGDTYAKFCLDVKNILELYPEKNFSIFTFDIDNFKYINSCYGFSKGDQILRIIYHAYQSTLTHTERCSRIYNDHYVILLEDASKERIDTLFQSELNIDGVSVYLSAGLYPITNSDESIYLMVDKANMAAQKIKGMRYKHVEVYSEKYDQQMIKNEQIKRAVEQALKDKEIIPYFQPKVDINTRKLVGAEALARWQAKDGKLISPGDFIPICEATGLIELVDMTIFEQTLHFIRHNIDMGVKCVPISVNFSRIHLLNCDFIHTLLSKLKAYDVPSHLIEIEITETGIFENYGMIQNFIRDLHANNLIISMDDFGSGYSSLHMLKDIEIDVIKIDRGFLLETENSERQKAVFAAIAQMAERLKVQVVVEGVENMENVSLMREFGCSIAQGYFYSKPIDEIHFQKFYQEGTVC